MKFNIICLSGFLLFTIRYYQYKANSKILFYHLKDKLRSWHSHIINYFYRFNSYLLILSALSIATGYAAQTKLITNLDTLFLVLLAFNIIVDRYIFWKSAFYGLEDHLFAGSIQSIFLLCFEMKVLNTQEPIIASIFSSAFLISIFINAGFDKFKSSDWMSGKGILIWMSLPQFRFFKLNKSRYNFIKTLSPYLSRFEIFHQLFFPFIALICLLAGNKLVLICFFFISLIFMITLIYPFNLNPIGIYGIIMIIISIQGIINENFISKVNYVLLASIVLGLGVNIELFNINKFIRILIGHVKVWLFSEYHLHGLLLLDYKHTNNKHIVKGLNHFESKIDIKRMMVNNQSWVNVLRLLDVLERAKENALNEHDFTFLSEFSRLFCRDKGEIFFNLYQLNWLYNRNTFEMRRFNLELSTEIEVNKRLMSNQMNILPFKTKRKAKYKGIGYSLKHILKN